MDCIKDLKNFIIAHRGVHDNMKIPENSILAFTKAIENNIPIELDIQLTKDNKLVVFHDYNLKRMTKRDAFIQNLTYEEVSKLTLLDTEEKIPTLIEVLNLVHGKVLLDIEIKNTDKVEEIGSILCEELDNYPGKFLIKSFDFKIVRWFRKNKKNYPLGLLITDNYDNKIYNYPLVINFFIRYCKPDFLCVSKRIIKEKRIQKYRKKYPLLIWTIKSSKDLIHYQKFCDSYICNNLPYNSKTNFLK